MFFARYLHFYVLFGGRGKNMRIVIKRSWEWTLKFFSFFSNQVLATLPSPGSFKWLKLTCFHSQIMAGFSCCDVEGVIELTRNLVVGWEPGYWQCSRCTHVLSLSLSLSLSFFFPYSFSLALLTDKPGYHDALFFALEGIFGRGMLWGERKLLCQGWINIYQSIYILW